MGHGNGGARWVETCVGEKTGGNLLTERCSAVAFASHAPAARAETFLEFMFLVFRWRQLCRPISRNIISQFSFSLCLRGPPFILENRHLKSQRKRKAMKVFGAWQIVISE